MKPLQRSLFLIAMLALCAAASAAEVTAPTFKLDIAAQPIDDALHEFGRQSGLQIFLASEEGKGVITAPVVGVFTAADGLSRLLANTGLRYEYLDSRTIAVRARTGGTGKGAAAGAHDMAHPLRLIQADGSKTTVSEEGLASAAGSGESSEVRVEGTRILNVDLHRTANDALPFQIVTAAEIEKMGVTSTTEFVSRLSQNASYENTLAGTASGGTQAGKTQVDLRGLGISNTLILVNGRRIGSSMAYSPQGNISGIPLAAIEQVEILSSGASAIYGASAVGGVVNLILRKEYSGTELGATFGNSLSAEGRNRRMSLLSGVNSPDKRSNATLFVDYADQSPMFSGDRGFAARIQQRVLEAQPALVNSFVIPPFASRGNVRSLTGAPLGIPGHPTATIAGIPMGYDGTGGAAAFASTAGRYNLDSDFFTIFPLGGSRGDQSTVLDESQNLAGGLNLYRRVNPCFNAFAEAFYARQQQSSPYHATSFARLVPARNAFNPFGVPVFVSNVLEDFGTGEFAANNDTQRAVAGFEGRLAEGWKYIADYTFERNHLVSDLSPQLASASEVSAHPFNQSDPARAYNPFLDFSGGARNPQAIIAQIRSRSRFQYDEDLQQAALRVRGKWMAGGWRFITVGAGIEHRREKSYDNTIKSYLMSTGQLLSSSINGRDSGDYAREVYSAYGEMQIPILEPASRRGLYAVDIDLAARLEDFSDFGTTTNPLAAVRIELAEGWALRASWGTGFVAPPLELINYNNLTDTGTVTDPRRGGESAAVAIDGNLSRILRPETSHSVSVGAVLQPRVLPGLRISLDWFSVRKKDNLTFMSPQSVVDNEGQLGGLVQRAAPMPGDGFEAGPITTVFEGYLNATRRHVKALDFGIAYVLPTRSGQWSIDGAGTLTDEFQIQLAADGPLVDYVNRPLDQADAPLRFRGSLGGGWARGPVSIGLTARYLNSYRARTGFESIQGSASVASSTEIDMRFGYDFREAPLGPHGWKGLFQGCQVAAGVNNLFDTAPPFVADSGFYGYSQFNSPRQAFYYFNIRKSFSP